MLTQITNELWLELDRVIRVARDGDEVKYTIDFKERMVTYCVDYESVGVYLLNVLKEIDLQMHRPVEELIQEMTTNPNGDTA